jgi:chaperonin cofactor prefoldin
MLRKLTSLARRYQLLNQELTVLLNERTQIELRIKEVHRKLQTLETIRVVDRPPSPISRQPPKPK